MKTFLSMTIRQKLILLLILGALIPTIGVLVWGVQRSINAPEMTAPAWGRSLL